MESFKMIKEGLFKCKTCGKEIPSGIFNISGHWVDCTGKDFYQEIIKIAEKTKNEKQGILDKTVR